MSNVICLKGETLAAALLCAPKDDIRYYMNGCLIESNATTTRMVVTDGHYLYAEDTAVDENTFTGSLIVPRATLELAKAKNGFWYIDVGSEQGRTAIDGPVNYVNCVLRSADAKVRITFDSVAGRFPDYCRVMPSGPFSGIAANLNADYLALAKKVAKLHTKEGIYKVFHNGPTNAVLCRLPRGVMVIMPMRNDDEVPDVSQFKGNLPAKEEVTS